MTTPTVDRRGLRLIVAALVAAVLLSSLDAMIFNTALPTIVGQLHGIARMSWVPTAYLLTTVITMPVYGKLGDLVGRKWLFVAALALFLSGSVVGGLAGSMPMLIAARSVQGLGAGGLMVLSQAIIADVVPPRERGRYMAIVGSVFIFSSVAGPLLGGWFTSTIGWRWAFWMNVPIALLAIVAAIALLHPPRPAARPTSTRRASRSWPSRSPGCSCSPRSAAAPSPGPRPPRWRSARSRCSPRPLLSWLNGGPASR